VTALGEFFFGLSSFVSRPGI